MDAALISSFDTAWNYQVTSREQVYHISSICDHAQDRTDRGNHPQVRFWQQQWEAQKERARGFNSAIEAFLKLDKDYRDDGKETSVTTQQWKDRFRLAVEKLGFWVEKMKELLSNEELKQFVAEEEAYIAAAPKEDPS